MCIFRVSTCNINTTILTQFVQYSNIDQITLHLIKLQKQQTKSKLYRKRSHGKFTDDLILLTFTSLCFR